MRNNKKTSFAKKLAASFLLFALAVSFAVGEDVSFASPFRLEPVNDSVIGGMGLTLSGTGVVLNKVVHFKNDTWNGTAFNKNDVPAVDRFFMRPFSKGLDIAGDILQFTALLSPAVLMAAPMEDWVTIGVMYAESVLVSYGAKSLAKAFVNRARPYMYYDNRPMDLVNEGDWNDSFMSGHSTLAFTGASFLSYVFSKYFGDSPLKYVVTAASYTVAATTAVLRVAGENHFLTDVLAGAVVGTASGFLVPWLHSFASDSGNGGNDGSSGLSKSVEPLVYLDGFGVRFSFR